MRGYSGPAMRLPVAPRATLLVGALVVALMAGACGAGGSPSSVPSAPPASSAGGGTYPGWPVGPVSGTAVVPVLINQQLAVGANRFLFTLFDAADQTKVVAAPDVT